MASQDFKKAEDIASSEGGPKTDAASTQRASATSDDKMENELEMKKSSKQSLDSSEDVAGQEKKGTISKVLDKVTGKGDSDPKVPVEGRDDSGTGPGIPSKNYTT